MGKQKENKLTNEPSKQQKAEPRLKKLTTIQTSVIITSPILKLLCLQVLLQVIRL